MKTKEELEQEIADVNKERASCRESLTGIGQRLKKLQNEYGIATASVFVTVEVNQRVEVLPVSKKVLTGSRHLDITMNNDEEIVISRAGSYREVHMYLTPGGCANFSFPDESRDYEPFRFVVRAFSSKDEADKWAAQRREGMSSR